MSSCVRVSFEYFLVESSVNALVDGDSMLRSIWGGWGLMYSYIKGIITDIETSYVVLENNGIGYMIYVANPYSYKVGSDVVIYLYQQIREDEHTLFGFKSL